MEMNLKLKWCVFFCFFLVALGATFFLITPQSRYGKLTFSFGFLWLVAGGLPLVYAIKYFGRREMGNLTVGEKLFLAHQKRQRNWKITRGIVACFALVGLGNLIGVLVTGCISEVVAPDWFIYGSLALMIGSFAAFKVLRV